MHHLHKFNSLLFLLFTPTLFAADPIYFSANFDTAEYSGQTYLSFMKTTIRPALNELASSGYTVVDGDTVEQVYDLVDAKIKRRIERDWGGLDNVKSIADALAGKTVTLDTLPLEIAKIDRSVDRYDLATFLGLASGGGVSIKYFEDN